MVLVILLFVGLCLGSFVNALVWRVHEQSKTKRSVKKNLSILHGRSICPHCQHELAAKDLVPVISWLWLRGKCRYCGQSISAQYPLVEILTAFLFLASYVYWPLNFNTYGTVSFVFWLIFLVGLVALAVYDLRWYLLPNRIIFPLLYLGALQAVLLTIFAPSPIHQLWGIALGLVIGGGIFYAIFQVSKGKWIGGGDVKLGFLLGLILADGGLMVLTIFLASIIGTLIALPLMITGKMTKKTKIPFGPLLIIGAIIARLFGAAMIHWYRRKLLLDT
jgi:prepilin signal peptidase PulO-like enzyme (type II secretory pathway)